MRIILSLCLVALFLGCCDIVQAAQGVERVERSEVVTTRSTIEGIDQKNRVVTLKDPQGNTFKIKAGEDVRNLGQLEAGDRVRVKYYRSVIVEMAEPGQQPMSTTTQGVQRAKPGEKPGGAVAEQVSTTARVTAIDKRNSKVTLKVPEGNLVTVEAADPNNLESLKVGDQINITYTEAVAISIEKA